MLQKVFDILKVQSGQKVSKSLQKAFWYSMAIKLKGPQKGFQGRKCSNFYVSLS